MRASQLRDLHFESSKKDVYIFLPFLESLLLFKSQSLAPVKIFGVGKGISGTFWMMAAGSWRSWVGRYCCYRLIQARSNGQRGAECGTLDPSCQSWLYSASFLKSGLGSQTTHPIKPCIEVVPMPHTRIDKISTVG